LGIGGSGTKEAHGWENFRTKGGDLGDIIAVELGLATGITAQHHDAR